MGDCRLEGIEARGFCGGGADSEAGHPWSEISDSPQPSRVWWGMVSKISLACSFCLAFGVLRSNFTALPLWHCDRPNLVKLKVASSLVFVA